MEFYDTYSCVVCCDDFAASEGVAACWEHFVCNACGVRAFEVAMRDTANFPATCCKSPEGGQIYHIGLFEHLLDDDFVKRYRARLQEYHTPEQVKVYCVNEHCGMFIPPSTFDDSDQRYTLATCSECETVTCVGCKKEWARDHRCEADTDCSKLPECIPQYAADCRIKRCPKCHALIEHQEACNHMTCAYCKAEFCFICLMPWIGVHDELGCPVYGEPSAGYDDEGYEQTPRGLHRLTGLDRKGLNQNRQQTSTGQYDAMRAFLDEQIRQLDFGDTVLGYFPRERLGIPVHRHDHSEDTEYKSIRSAHLQMLRSVDYYSEELGAVRSADGGPYPVPATDDTTSVDSFPPPPLSFEQLDCDHGWMVNVASDWLPPKIAFCQLCNGSIQRNRYACHFCEAHLCFECHENSDRFEYYTDCANFLVGPLVWAEQDAPPFRADKKKVVEDGDDLGLYAIETMFDQCWDEVYFREPFHWWDYGIDDMFAPLEEEVNTKDPYVVLENVGFSGLTFTSRIDRSFFTVLEHEVEA